MNNQKGGETKRSINGYFNSKLKSKMVRYFWTKDEFVHQIEELGKADFANVSAMTTSNAYLWTHQPPQQSCE
eukprot:6471837-Amphidinium_carterae.1